jgi:hypothetical protein
MQIKIEDPDYFLGDPSITWCGTTWTPTEIQNGVWKCVCPSVYGKYSYLLETSVSTAIHAWQVDNGGTGPANLYMLRSYIITGTTANAVGIQGGTLAGVKRDFFSASFGVPNLTVTTLGVVPTSILKQKPVIADYLLTEDPQWLNGSYVNGAVTYSWKQGINWP